MILKSDGTLVISDFEGPYEQEEGVVSCAKYLEKFLSNIGGALMSIGKEYGIKALKIRLLTNEILFLDEKISEFERGERCSPI